MRANDRSYQFHNYAVGFLDLLGQRAALQGEGLLPVIQNEDDRKKFIDKARSSIGAIVDLQHAAERMIGAEDGAVRGSKFRAKLSDAHQRMWDEMLQRRLSSQRWSDGLVYFLDLGDETTKCPVNGIYDLIALAGSLCLLGLTKRKPLRGAIDIAWAIELHPGEIYGAAVARAYELESEVAQWPRIVVGARALGFLEWHRDQPKVDLFSDYNKSLAALCLRMLVKDIDGNSIVDYLGEEFQRSITQQQREELYRDALVFVQKEVERHHASKDEKLYERYYTVLRYFHAKPPLKVL